MENSSKKRLRRCLCRMALALMAATAAAVPAHAETDYAILQEKAERFYAYREWASALAMYELMLMQKPDDMPTYGYAIIANASTGNAEGQLRLVERTQENGIALAELFEFVRIQAFAIARPDIYENLLRMIREEQPWLKRNIDLQLLAFYEKRNNAPRMIAVCDSLLAVNPDDLNTLSVKARGLMIGGNLPEATAVYERILAADSLNCEALRYLGIYHYRKAKAGNAATAEAEAKAARHYLQALCRQSPTPYVGSLLKKLRVER